MAITGQGLRQAAPTPLGEYIDVYKCLSCGDTFATNADHLTFSKPPPLECDHCGDPDMQAGRYHGVGASG